MKQQTFIIEVNPEMRLTDKRDDYYDFFRVGCKRKETALRYLKGWIRQAKEKGWESLFKCFFVEGGTYRVTATPDGYHPTDIVCSGLIADLMKQ